MTLMKNCIGALTIICALTFGWPAIAADSNPWRVLPLNAPAQAQPDKEQSSHYGRNTYAPMDNSLPPSAAQVEAKRTQPQSGLELPSPYGEHLRTNVQGGYGQPFGYGGAPAMGGLGMPGAGLPGFGLPGFGLPGLGYSGLGYPGVGYPGLGYPGSGWGNSWGGGPWGGGPWGSSPWSRGPWGGSPWGNGWGGPAYGGPGYNRWNGFNNGPRPWGPYG